MRIALHPKSDDLGPFQVLRRCKGAIEAAGHNVVEHADQSPRPKGADVWIVHQSFATREVLDNLPDQSVILMERIDSAQLWSREQAAHPAVFACPKPAALPVSRLRSEYHRDHESLLDAENASGGLSEISEETAEKVCAGPHYGQYNRIGRFGEQGPGLDAKRPLDLFFAGSIDIYNETISNHRKACCIESEKLGDEFNVKVVHGKDLPRQQYDEHTRQAKVVVSPWGNGELCHRDFDAMWCGAVVVKPFSDYLRTDPVMFRDGHSYFSCKPDWSDLREVVRHIVQNWDALRDMRTLNYAKVHAAFRPEYTAAWLNRLLTTGRNT